MTKSKNAYRVLLGKLESKSPLGRPGHRGKVVINIYNRPALLGFADVCLPNHDAVFHVIVMSRPKVRFFLKGIFRKGAEWAAVDGQLLSILLSFLKHTINRLNERKFIAVS
jgi:hypothetical protein